MRTTRAVMFTMAVVGATFARAANHGLFVAAEVSGPNIKVYGTNPYLRNQNTMPPVPQETVVTTPPYQIAIPVAMSQPFGPLANGPSVFSLPFDIDFNFAGTPDGGNAQYNGHDVVVIGSGPGIVPPQVQVWANYSNELGRTERDTFRQIASFAVPDFGPAYSAGINVAAGDFNADGNLEIAVGRRNGEPRIALYQVAGGGLDFGTLGNFGGAVFNAPVTPYLIPNTGNSFVAFPEVPAGYNGGVRPTIQFGYAWAIADVQFNYTMLVTAPGKGFKPMVRTWFLHDGTVIAPPPPCPCCCCVINPIIFHNAFDVALANEAAPLVLSEFLAFKPSYKGGVNVTHLSSPSAGTAFGVATGLYCGQGNGGGELAFFLKDRYSDSFDDIQRIKPFGAAFTGGINVSHCNRELGDVLLANPGADTLPGRSLGTVAVFADSQQTGALAQVRFRRNYFDFPPFIYFPENVLLRFKPFGNARFRSSP